MTPLCRTHLALAFALAIPAATGAVETTLVPLDATWKYLVTATAPAATWTQAGFDDATWASGPAELGYGDGDEATTIGYGSDPAKKHVTTYFRQAFTVDNPDAYASLQLQLRADDGAAVYLNGSEVYRINVGTSGVFWKTLAKSNVAEPYESLTTPIALSPAALVAGANVLAIEIHQASITSPDLSFAAALVASDLARVIRGPYLQMARTTGMVVRWRTDAPTSSRVRYGTDPGTLDLLGDDPTLTVEHEVTLTGLAPATLYTYTVGSIEATLASAPDQRFRTAPVSPDAGRHRIWVLGDSGTVTPEQWQVRDAYTRETGDSPTDLWLMLGDNAYPNGTDAEYQSAVFAAYPDRLRSSPLWPTIGNHDSPANPPPTLPYYQMFSLPSLGESGGVPSGTEDYYSFDFGDLHFVCLDSMTSDRSPGGAMLTWLDEDLAATTRKWIIAFWHHPPYSHGGHNSDFEGQLTEMRQNALPVLESHGVDLVLSGHSHNYERSYLIDHHYGTSFTLTSDMVLDSGSGRIDQGGAYHKATAGMSPHEGAVYTVAGSSGETTPVFPHPAMHVSLSRLGSLVLEVEGNRLDVRFLREDGTSDDYFTIEKGDPPAGNQPPAVRLVDPPSGTTLAAPADVTLTADASDADGTVERVDFYAGEMLLGTATSSPWTIVWGGVPTDGYTVTARAIDDLGAISRSDPISVKVIPAASPAAPSALAAFAGCTSRIELSWLDNASDEDGFRIERSTNGTSFSYRADVGAGVREYWDTSVSAFTTYYYRVRAWNGAGDSAFTAAASATTAALLPAPPANLVALATCSNRVDLTWTDASCNETSFKIERSTNGGSFSQIASVGADVTAYGNTGLTPATSYTYRVRALNNQGYSAYSNLATAATPAAAVPAAPASLAATALSGSQIRLDWSDLACDESGFRIERSTGGGAFAQVASVGANATTFTNAGLGASTTYTYRVRAWNAIGYSAYSNTASATTHSEPPPPPSGLGATPFCSSRIDLTWIDNSTNELGFKIERSPDGTTFAQIATVGKNKTLYKDGTVAAGTTYWYRVRSYNASGDSAYSNVASGTTLPAVPAAPSGLTATTVSQTEIRLNWIDNSCNESGFRIERALGGGTFSQIASVGKNITTYLSAGLAPGTTYTYRVRAYAGGGVVSGYSNPASATTNP